MWRPDEKLTFLSSNCCLQWRIQERGPGAPLFLDQNELLMNTTLVIDGKWLSVECCLETENAPWRPTPVWHHGRHHPIWARALKLTNMLNANVHKKPCYRHYEVVTSKNLHAQTKFIKPFHIFFGSRLLSFGFDWQDKTRPSTCNIR